MRTLLVVVAVAGCGGSSKPAAAPPPATIAPVEKPEPVAVASDPEEGGQVASASPPVAAAAPPADDLQVSGDIDRDLVRRTIRARLSQIKGCYEKSLQANPSLQGKVTVTFTIEKDGTVKTAKAEGVDDNLDRCIEGRFKTLVFPKATSTATIVYPIDFSRQ
jgi:hypothetical protein